MPRPLSAALAVLLFAASVHAKVETMDVDYEDRGAALQGFLARDPEKAGEGAPAVLIVHQWMGLTDHEKSRAKQLAELGYVAFAVDVYGKGERPKDRGEAGKFAGKYKNDRALLRQRLQAGLATLKAQKGVDPKRIAVIGYCFGGTAAIELARSGADIAAAVSFHGGLDSPTPDDGKNIKAKILVCHGADDPFVKADDIEAMKKEFNAAGVDWQMVYYSGAVHSFTQREAGTDNAKGAAYNEAADRRSWAATLRFFDEALAKK